MSWTFATVQDGWALGLNTSQAMGCAVVAHTVDGGRTWQPAGSPPAVVGGPDCSTCLWGLRFANATTGYAFGDELFVTTDGGMHWSKESAPPIPFLEDSDGLAVRVVSTCNAMNPCRQTVEEAAVGSSTWKTVDAPTENWTQLGMVGRSTLYLRGANDLWRSTDSGMHWRQLPNPCALLPTRDRAFPPQGQPGAITQVAATGTSLVVICISSQIAAQQAGYQQDIAVSHDGGTTFGPIRPVPHLQGLDGGSGIYGVGLPSGSTVAVVGSEGGVQTSFDEGLTWNTAVPQPTSAQWSPQPIGFETPSVGHVVFPANTVLTTRDGGRTWTSFVFP